MNKFHNLLLENINTLKLLGIDFRIIIDNEIYENSSSNKKEHIKVQYKGKHYVEIVFFENIDYIFLLSLDSIVKDFCSIKKEKDIDEKILNFISNLKPNIKFKKTIENIKKTLKSTFSLDEIKFYLSANTKFFENIEFITSTERIIPYISCNIDKMRIPVILENLDLGYFVLIRNKGFTLYDYALIYKLNDYIKKNIENSFLENKFNIILDKSLNVLTIILETRVPGAEKHCENILKSAIKFGEILNLSNKNIQNLKFGSMIFDIGKIGIPEKILSKKGELTLEENNLIKKHVIYGYNLVSKIPTIPEEVKKIVLYHHEKWNGEGYPEGLTGDNIPLLAQIIGLLDTYYSLLEDRPYRSKLPKTKAIELIDSYSDVFFNPILVDVLKEVVKND
ncbi:HD-GYP domain-containing protein [Marinitoga aeolica]|uniref:HD domain-containing protein n=1 Tax=Marinitoga aeolica TaxID=2809031 RepID=A0ABY8PQB9_9BACT|nr:HD domain-containing phosphohydrolase [Marinitoga aeolica]WGS64796.1 HD domain-containing protein [Marinitoga aeolica]